MIRAEKLDTMGAAVPWDGTHRRARLAGNMLEVFLPDGWPESDAAIRWCVRSAAGVTCGDATQLSELPANVKRNTLLAWTPPADTLLTHAQLPTRNSRKIAQALPFALEDQLLGDPEELHFAYLRNDDGALAVAVTARERLQTWLRAFQAVGLQPSRLCPATLALPLDVDDWAIAFVDESLWVRSGPYAGFVCGATVDSPPPLLSAALEEAQASDRMPAQLTVFNAPAGFPDEAWGSALRLNVVVADYSLWESRVGVMPAMNMLQGDFAPTRDVRNRLRPLLPAAVMVAIWSMGILGFASWEWWQLNRQHRSYQQTMTALFKQTFPDAKVVLDPALQMQRKLDTLQGQSGSGGRRDLLPLLAGVAPVLRANPKAALRTLKYADAKLTLDIRLPDFEGLEAIKNAMNATRALRVEVVSANSQGSGVEGRLRITPVNGAAAGPR
ncbi:MAG: type II secretion system protein GspL [Acidiferrobacterales bacterium]